MKKQSIAEAYALERVMDLLDEGSVTYLAEQDASFARFVSQIHHMLGEQSFQLRRGASN